MATTGAFSAYLKSKIYLYLPHGYLTHVGAAKARSELLSSFPFHSQMPGLSEALVI